MNIFSKFTATANMPNYEDAAFYVYMLSFPCTIYAYSASSDPTPPIDTIHPTKERDMNSSPIWRQEYALCIEVFRCRYPYASKWRTYLHYFIKRCNNCLKMFIRSLLLSAGNSNFCTRGYVLSACVHACYL